MGDRPRGDAAGHEERFARSQTVFADAGDQGRLEQWTAEELGLALQIVPKLAGQGTFVVLPKKVDC